MDLCTWMSKPKHGCKQNKMLHTHVLIKTHEDNSDHDDNDHDDEMELDSGFGGRRGGIRRAVLHVDSNLRPRQRLRKSPTKSPKHVHLGVLGTSSFRLAFLRTGFDVLCCFQSHRSAFISLQWIRRVILRRWRDRNRAKM